MNIAVCLNTLSAGGAEILATNIALEFAKKGHDVTVIVFFIRDSRGLAIEKSLNESHVDVINLHRVHVYDMVSYPYKLAKIFKKRKIEVVHSHLEQMDLMVAMSRLFYHKAVYIRTLHSRDAMQTIPIILHKWLFKQFHANVGCGNFLVTDYSIQSLRNQIVPINNGVPIPDFSEEYVSQVRKVVRNKLGIKENDIVFIQNGRMGMVLGCLAKAHDLTFEAFHLLPDLDAHVIFIGDDKEKGNADFYNQEYVNDRRFHFMGLVNDPVSYLLTADIALTPSRLEGLPLATTEAAVLGLPIVCSSLKAFDVFTGRATVRFEQENASSLADVIASTCKNICHLKELACHDKELYKQNFSISYCTKQYINEIEKHR